MSASLFEGLPADQVANSLAGFERRRFGAGSTVLAQGDSFGELYLIESGAADVFVADRDGAEHHVARVGPGTTLGEMSLFTGHPASGTVRACTNLQVVVVTAQSLDHLGHRLPRIYRNIGVILAERLAAANRLSVGDRTGRVTVLVDRGAPSELVSALRASLAWHTDAPVELSDSAERSANQARVFVRVASDGDQLPEATSVVELLGSMGRPAVSQRRLAVRAWGDGPVRRGPDGDGVIWIPRLSEADHTALSNGILPPSTPAGAALGWVARDIAGLKVGLALGAGSYRGYAHVGVLRALARIGIEPDYLAGTSIGAGVAALHAFGYSTDELAAYLDELEDVLFRPTVSRRSLLSNVALAAKFRDAVAHARIEDLPLPLAIIAADLESGREIVFRRGLVWLAVLASSSIPGVYPAVRVGPYAAIDGGIVNPVPHKTAAVMGADKVIAVRLGRPRPTTDSGAEARDGSGRVPSAIEAMVRSVELMQTTMRAERSTTTITIEPECEDVPTIGLRRFSLGRRYIQAGEAAVEAAVPRIAAALPWVRADRA
jgi:NTE family protein